MCWQFNKDIYDSYWTADSRYQEIRHDQRHQYFLGIADLWFDFPLFEEVYHCNCINRCPKDTDGGIDDD